MKISPLQSFNPNYKNNSIKNNNAPKNIARTSVSSEAAVMPYGQANLRDTTYNSLQIKRSSPVFAGALEKSARALAKQIPLDERLADAFSFMKHGDLIITGKKPA